MEEILERKYLKNYMLRQLNFFALCKELFCSKETLGKIIDSDIKEVKTLRQSIREKMGADNSNISEKAELWSLLLKPKVVALKFWSSFSTSMIALIGSALLAARYLSSLFNDNNSWTLILAFIFCTVLLLLFKSYIEQRVSWLELIGWHLDAISKSPEKP